jgi:hypothetical protein
MAGSALSEAASRLPRIPRDPYPFQCRGTLPLQESQAQYTSRDRRSETGCVRFAQRFCSSSLYRGFFPRLKKGKSMTKSAGKTRRQRGPDSIHVGPAPSDVFEAVHALLHQIDRGNHNRVWLRDGTGEHQALEIHPAVRSRECEGPLLVGFWSTRCDVSRVTFDSPSIQRSGHTSPIATFAYTDSNLLVQLLRTLRRHGLRVPKRVFRIAEQMLPSAGHR